jgi:MFS family permease
MSVTAAPPAALTPPRRERSAWVNVTVAALLMVATLPGRSHGLGLFTKPLLLDFQLDEVVYGHINLWATLLGAAFCLPCGWLIDRLGTRGVMASVVAALGLVAVAMSRTHSVVALAVLILLTRGFGQSALSVVSLAVVGKTELRRREVAMGIFSVLIGVGFALAVQGVKVAEEVWKLDWRQIWRGLGLVLLVGVLPVSCLLYRKPAGGTDRLSDAEPSGGGATLAQALRSSTFWAFALACSLYLLVSSGVNLYGELILEDFGFNRAVFLDVQSLTFALGVVFNLLCGWLAQRWSMGRLLGLASLVLAAALVGLPMAHTLPQLYAFAAAVAFSGGAVTVVFFAVWRHAFGLGYLGQIQGAAQMLTVLASAFSQDLFPVAKAWAGSYVPLLQSLAAVAVLLGVWVFFVPLPRTEVTTAGNE